MIETVFAATLGPDSGLQHEDRMLVESSTTCPRFLGPAAAAGDAAVHNGAAGDAAGGCHDCLAGAASEAAAFDLPPEFECGMYDMSQQQPQADFEEDVFGHGDDLGEAAYHDQDGV